MTSILLEELHRLVRELQYRSRDRSNPFPELNSAEALADWLRRVEADMTDVDIPQAQWSDAAIILLENSALRIEIKKLRQLRVESGVHSWPWVDFKDSLRESLLKRIESTGPSTAAVIAGTGLVIAGAAVLGPAMVIGGLYAAGFTSAGVAAGSLAAGIQSTFYGPATAGLFSLCQSIGATAVAPSLAASVLAAGRVLDGANLIRGSLSRGGGDGNDQRGGGGSGRDSDQGGGDDQDDCDTPDGDDAKDCCDDNDSDDDRFLPDAPVATPPEPIPGARAVRSNQGVVVGPIIWGTKPTGSVRTLILMTPNCGEIDTTRLRTWPTNNKRFILVTGLSSIDAVTFSHNFTLGPPNGYECVSVEIKEFDWRAIQAK